MATFTVVAAVAIVITVWLTTRQPVDTADPTSIAQDEQTGFYACSQTSIAPSAVANQLMNCSDNSILSLTGSCSCLHCQGRANRSCRLTSTLTSDNTQRAVGCLELSAMLQMSGLCLERTCTSALLYHMCNKGTYQI